MILTSEIYEKISIFLEAPLEMSLCCKSMYESISSCRVKALWIKRNFKDILKTRFIEKRWIEKVLEGGNEVYQLSSLVGEEEVLNLAEQKKRARFMAVLNEPVFFNLINADQISLSLWGSFAIRNGFERSTVLLLKKYPLSTIDSNLLIQLTVESCLQSRLSILPVLSERLAKENIQIPYSVLIFAAKQFLKDSDRDDFEYFQSSQIILEMENLLPPSKEIRLRFLSETLQFSLYDIRICLNILRKFETIYISDLNINWNVIDNEKRFTDLIYGLASINKLLDRNGVVYQPLLESAIMKDYISSFISLINIGTNIPITLSFI